jgi:penicillin-binding protein 1C
VLPPAMEYYYKSKGLSISCAYRHFRADCASTPIRYGADGTHLPEGEGAKIYIPLEADGKRGRMICNAAHRQAGMKIFWHLDDQYIGETKDYHQIALNPSTGPHTLTLVDGDGNTLKTNFEVLDKEK